MVKPGAARKTCRQPLPPGVGSALVELGLLVFDLVAHSGVTTTNPNPQRKRGVSAGATAATALLAVDPGGDPLLADDHVVAPLLGKIVG